MLYTIEEAVELKRDTIAQCRATLPLAGRAKSRDHNAPDLLTPALLDIVSLLAPGKRPSDIAATLGEDKSAVSHQIVAARSRLHADTVAAAVAKARELGLITEEECPLRPEPSPIKPCLQRVLDLHREGKSLAQIAVARNITPGSAKVYRNSARAQARELGI